MTKQEQKLIEHCKEISKQLNKQNNRRTQHPIFVVEQDVKVYDDAGEFRERARDYEFEDLCEDCQKIEERGKILPEDCRKCNEDCFEFYYNIERQISYKTIFLTEKECEEHIQRNDYNYKNPKSYAISVWRSPQLQELLKLISSLTTKDGKSRDCYL